MKKLLAIAFMLSGLMFITSCTEDTVDPDNGVTISGLTAAVSIENLGTYGPVTVTFEGADGLASVSLTKDGAAYGDTTFTGAPTTASLEFGYTATEADEDANIVFVFTATDADGDVESSTVVISVGEATPPRETIVLSGVIDEDMTLTPDGFYELAGRVIVTGGATLTIEPGTIIKGRLGEGSNASVLMIARDGMIDAEGTAEKPIIFTSVNDNIALGALSGTNLTATDNQLWGGVVILGNAPISVEAGTSAQIEGVPASEPLGQYGGDNATHSSGTFKYVSLRHGGTTIDPVAGNDINGLTLGGVGSGTVISNIEVFANYDDGIEFFGGSVNVTNVLVYTVGDDGLDVDQAYSGTIDNFLVYTSTAASSDEGLEIDGPEGSENATGKFNIKNGTITSVDGGGSGADFKSKAQGSVTNVKWANFTGGSTVKIRASFNADCTVKTDAMSHLTAGDLSFTTVEFAAIKVYSDQDCATELAAAQASAEASVTIGTATGVSDATVFASWTAAAQAGLL
ncbi:hypothetical protein [Marinoscillum sp. 108]|uniref:hypothetical protein n=1 Tax=Marinoscillum sp. 108 TaxID=2653151 RepID=UPI0012F36AE3|nr:hypothetical protein [Marinoscillum sp. 108]VXD17542.1 conserved exported hypothetical protein [Marinoscillum sp. 108]